MLLSGGLPWLPGPVARAQVLRWPFETVAVDPRPANDRPDPVEEPSGPQSEGPQDENREDKTRISWGQEFRALTKVSGSFAADFRQRATPSKIDQDFHEYLSLEFGDPREQRISGSFFGSLSQDIDGRSLSPFANAGEPWFAIDDTFQDNVHGRLFHAFLEFHDVIPGAATGRIGRQQLYGDLPGNFDGAFVEFEPLAMTRWGFYGGVPVNFWEASPAGDSLVGTSLQSTPLRWDPAGYTSVGVEFQRYADSSGDFGDHTDNVTSLRLGQELGPWTRVSGRARFLNDRMRDVSLDATLRLPSTGTRVVGSLYAQLMTIRDFTNAYTDYFGLLGTSEEFQEVSLRATQDLTEHFDVEAGAQAHRVTDDPDEAVFNHDFERVFLSLLATDLPAKGIEGSLFVERWTTPSDHEDTAGFDLSCDLPGDLRLSGGVSYALFKFSQELGLVPLRPDLREDVWTGFVKGRLPLGKNLDATASFRVEHSDLDTFNTFLTSLVYAF